MKSIFKIKRYFGAKTVNKWRREYLEDWRKRMDRLQKPSSGPVTIARHIMASENNTIQSFIGEGVAYRSKKGRRFTVNGKKLSIETYQSPLKINGGIK